ncbi:MAG: TolC family protein [Dysgonamonadaceae bacterium]|jgi:outer membrane protein TolC|nr:TolC family protein [Dysgonamonadaceae bacterium]
MKRIINLSGFIIGFSVTVFAQLTIEDCQTKARENYPLIKKYDLIKQSKEYNLANASKAYLPQFQLNVRATYQSEVTSIPISIPGITIPDLKKDQYQAVMEASQMLWDGGAVRSQRKMTEAGSEVETQQVEVELYTLRERINQLFFGILLFDMQLEQNQILQDELQRNYAAIAASVEFGVANRTDLDVVKVEQLNAKQIRIQIQTMRNAFVEMLAIMTGEKPDKNVNLKRPAVNHLLENEMLSSVVKRPEIQLFDAQNNLFDSQKNLIKSAYMPKVGLFLQGGIGRPGLNMLSNEIKPFYIGGIRLSWNFGALYTQKNDLRKIEINKNAVNVQKDIFLYNINLTTTREIQEIKRLNEIMKQDDEIITLRENIRKSAEAKVANGTLTVTELMREISQESWARQTKATHEIDLLIAIYNLKNMKNSDE